MPRYEVSLVRRYTVEYEDRQYVEVDAEDEAEAGKKAARNYKPAEWESYRVDSIDLEIPTVEVDGVCELNEEEDDGYPPHGEADDDHSLDSDPYDFDDDGETPPHLRG